MPKTLQSGDRDPDRRHRMNKAAAVATKHMHRSALHCGVDNNDNDNSTSLAQPACSHSHSFV